MQRPWVLARPERDRSSFFAEGQAFEKVANELAQTVGVHPTYLARAFRAQYGLSVGEYGRRLRLAWAAAELARGDTPLAEIAASAGFADQSHFTRVFKTHLGSTPARYREQTRSPSFNGR